MNFLNQFNIATDVEIEFICENVDWDVIPKPFASRKYIPEWFRKLSPKINREDKLENSTIKRCPPFLDAMTTGWIIPLCADIQIETNDDASGLTWKHNFYKPVIESHTHEQVKGNPEEPKPPMKFLNYWMVKVPKGYSVLFIPPLNRPDPRFECIAGYVDCDQYFEYINFPFFFKQPNFTGIIEAGTPLVQVIPVKRKASISKSNIRVFTEDELALRALTRRRRQSHESYYRDNLWQRNKP